MDRVVSAAKRRCRRASTRQSTCALGCKACSAANGDRAIRQDFAAIRWLQRRRQPTLCAARVATTTAAAKSDARASVFSAADRIAATRACVRRIAVAMRTTRLRRQSALARRCGCFTSSPSHRTTTTTARHKRTSTLFSSASSIDCASPSAVANVTVTESGTCCWPNSMALRLSSSSAAARVRGFDASIDAA